MARGAGIIAQAEPKGVFKEGTITDTSKPGTVMQIVPGTLPVGGRYSYQYYQPSAAGDPRAICVLLCAIDNAAVPPYIDQNTAYAVGNRCAVYYPLPGDEMNMLVKDISGTGDTHTIGDRFNVDNTSGKLIVQSTSANPAAFQCLETVPAFTADGLLLCMRN